MTPYASLEDLKKRLDWTLDEGEERVAETALEDATDLAIAYGREWDFTSTPRLVRTLVLKSASRYMKNYQGYILSRAGDETVQWSDKAGEDMGTVYFTRDEIKLIEGLAGRRTALISAPVIAYNSDPSLDDGFRPVAGGGKPFPMFEVGEQP